MDGAAGVLRDGGVLGYAAETVYGLGCRADNTEAVERIQKIKGRGDRNQSPFLLLIANARDLERITAPLDPEAARFLAMVWPGPVTAILPVKAGPYQTLASSSGGIGLRRPDDAELRELIRRAGGPIVSTSANRSGAPVMREASSLVTEFGDKLDAVWDRGARNGDPSAVVDLTGEAVRLLRRPPKGVAIVNPATLESLSEELPVVSILVVCTGNTCRSAMAGAILSSEFKRLRIPAAVVSAGTNALDGQPASEGASAVLDEIGFDLSLHRSQSVNAELLERADHILVMEEHHATRITEKFGDAVDPQKDSSLYRVCR